MPKDGARIPSTALGLLSALGPLNFGHQGQVRKVDSQGWCVSLSGQKVSPRPEAHILIVSLYCCFQIRKATHIRVRIDSRTSPPPPALQHPTPTPTAHPTPLPRSRDEPPPPPSSALKCIPEPEAGCVLPDPLQRSEASE